MIDDIEHEIKRLKSRVSKNQSISNVIGDQNDSMVAKR